MFNTGVSPVIKLSDYTLTLVPKDNFLQLKGEYHLESNFSIPDNFIELSHRFSSQIVDKLFLKASDKSCTPINQELKCKVYTNSSFIDFKNDPELSNLGFSNSQIPFSTNFSINSQAVRKIHSHDVGLNKEFQALNDKLSKLSFNNKFSLKNNYFLSDKDLNDDAGYFNLNLKDKVVLKPGGIQEDEYSKLRIYLSNWSELTSGSPLLYLWNLEDKENNLNLLKVKTLQGRLILTQEGNSNNQVIDLRDSIWRESRSRQELLELIDSKNYLSFLKNYEFKGGELDIQFSIAKGESIHNIHLKSKIPYKNESKKLKKGEIFINPYDPVLKKVPLDHTWIVEKI